MFVTIAEPKVNVVNFDEAFDETLIIPQSEIDGNTDVVLLWSISQMPKVKHLVNKYPIVVYCWDLYEWAVNGVRGPQERTEYEQYAELMKKAVEVWVPSKVTAKRLKEFYGITHTKVIKTAVPYFNHTVKDRRYVLQPIRDIPDQYNGWVERACAELKIPVRSPDHQLPEEDWHETVANCSFIASALYEGSTGGLSVMEGYYLGKYAIGTDSPYSGLKEYMGDRIDYFQTYGELKDKIAKAWDNTPQVASDHKQYIETFSQAGMGKQMEERLCTLIEVR